jgi:ribosomal protein S18 acetylase RimI-like enzyme
MKVRLDAKVHIIEASVDYVESWLVLLRELPGDTDSYTLVNYSGQLPTYDQAREMALQWNREGIRMHFVIFQANVVGYMGQRVGPNYGVILQPHVSEIWYAVSREFRKTGLIYTLMHQSFKSLNVKYLLAYVDSRNESSLNLLQKLGFGVVSLLKEYLLNNW